MINHVTQIGLAQFLLSDLFKQVNNPRSANKLLRWTLLFLMLMLLGCQNRLQELIDSIPPAGVKVVFGPTLTTANKKAATNNPGNVLQVKLSSDGTTHSMTVSASEAWIDWDSLQLKLGDHLYELSIYYPNNSATEPLLIARGSLSDRSTRIEFTESMLNFSPYDVDNSGNISQDEQVLLDFDEDGMANLAEILVNGDPSSPGPTFLSASTKNFPEQQNKGSNYLVYTPKIVSPVENAVIHYEILAGNTDSFNINQTTGELYLDTESISPWPRYDPDNINQNTFAFTLQAQDSTGSTQFDLTLLLTDRLNLNVTVEVKTLKFHWDKISDNLGNPAYYKLFENSDANTTFKEVPFGNHITTTDFRHEIALHRINWHNVQYKLKAFSSQDDSLITSIESAIFSLTDPIFKAIGYVKSPGTNIYDAFGRGAINVSADGSTLAVGAGAYGFLGIGPSTSIGAVHLYIRPQKVTGEPIGPWTFATTLTAPNASAGDGFGGSISLSADGNLLAIGAVNEDNPANGTVDTVVSCPDANSGCMLDSGAVYVFKKPIIGWKNWNDNYYIDNVGYLKAPDATPRDNFGLKVNISGNGEVLVISQGDASRFFNKVYVIERPIAGWTNFNNNVSNKVAYINAPGNMRYSKFGRSISINFNGDIIAVAAPQEHNGANMAMLSNICFGGSGIGCASKSGAVYVLQRPATGSWVDWDNVNHSNGIAYIKAPNAGALDEFGSSISLNGDGTILAVGARNEDNAANDTMLGIDSCTGGKYENGCAPNSGAVYIIERPAIASWSIWDNNVNGNDITYIKNRYADIGDEFGRNLSISVDGKVLAVGVRYDDNIGVDSGSVYVFQRPISGSWSGYSSDLASAFYLRAKNGGTDDRFGLSVSLSGDGKVLAVGAYTKTDNALSRTSTPIQSIPTESTLDGIDVPVVNNSPSRHGAVYLY